MVKIIKFNIALAMIINVGYRVKSKNGVIFRKWTTNKKRSECLEKSIKLIDIAGRIDTELKRNFRFQT